MYLYSTLRSNKTPTKNQTNGTLRKRPVPTPRTILNVDKIDRLIRTYSQFVIDPNGPDDYCPVCNVHLDEVAQVENKEDSADLNSVVCLTSCQHKVHLACLKWFTPELSSCLKCPTCGAISGKPLAFNFLYCTWTTGQTSCGNVEKLVS